MRWQKNNSFSYPFQQPNIVSLNPLCFTDHFAIAMELLGWDLDCDSHNTYQLLTGLGQLHAGSIIQEIKGASRISTMSSMRWIWMVGSKDHQWRASTSYWIMLTTRTSSVKYSTSASCILISFKPLTLLCDLLNALDIQQLAAIKFVYTQWQESSSYLPPKLDCHWGYLSFTLPPHINRSHYLDDNR